MKRDYDHYTVRQLRELVWSNGLIEKRWMLNYVKKKEAIALLTKFTHPDEVPEKYLEKIKARSSDHRKKVYRSKKDRQAKFGAPLTREERLKLVMNTADSLIFKEKIEHDSGFTSYLGSTRGKIAFVFIDSSGAEYSFTKAEVQRMSALGLYIPRGVMTNAQTKPNTSTSRKLRDLYNEGS
jgi:hypothetical protein